MNFTFTVDVPAHSRAVAELLSNDSVYGVLSFENTTDVTQSFTQTIGTPNGVVIDQVRVIIFPL
ncbi:hypothetical protein M3Y14_31725 (plasmid) [Bacillus thuringiensis]|uniref:hypothetical protein n=1 Tax=Bacillus thuringiensis TaxID=1428 RepID=UPI0022246784|nr:hypothetical protein [Bacillus thuringiensis]UYX55605.1 hypothetical protein M3Y14_31725 [Bacillus thuringiensis]